MPEKKFELHVDTSELKAACDRMRNCLSQESFEKLLRRTVNEVGKRSKKPISDAVRREYEAKAGWVKSAIGSAQMRGGNTIRCVIPLSGSRGLSKIDFQSGGKRSKGHIPKGKRYKVWIRDVKGKKSILPYSPEKMKAYGGQPPFINGGDAVMTRTGKKRGPLRRIAGVALPQMPINKAQEETEERILKLCEQRLTHNFERMFTK